MNKLFQDAIKKTNAGTPPIWFMRQAGRYHSHYQNLRRQHGFMELCKVPELACEVALGPILDFDFDVSILFSDLLFPLEALGMGLEYLDSGPSLGWKLTPETFPNLKAAEETFGFFDFQKQAMQLTRAKLPSSKSLIGFVGGPWTLFVYAVHGGHAGNLIESKNAPELFSSFQKILVPVLEHNIQVQLDGGAEVVMLFDTAAGEVSQGYYRAEIAASLLHLCRKFPGQLAYYSKGTQRGFFSEEFLKAPWLGIGVDHRWNLPELLGSNFGPGFVQGNFDQAFLFAEGALFEKHMDRYIEEFKKLPATARQSWVSGLGHGVLPKTPEKNVRRFIERIRKEFP